MAVSEIHIQSPEWFQPKKVTNNKKQRMYQTFTSARFLIVAPQTIQKTSRCTSFHDQRENENNNTQERILKVRAAPILADLETPMLRVSCSIITHPCRHNQSSHHSNIAGRTAYVCAVSASNWPDHVAAFCEMAMMARGGNIIPGQHGRQGIPMHNISLYQRWSPVPSENTWILLHHASLWLECPWMNKTWKKTEKQHSKTPTCVNI